jgi:beta-glucosidase
MKIRNLIATVAVLATTSAVSAQNPPQLRPDNIDEVVAAMTLEEKATLVNGTGMFMPGFGEQSSNNPIIGMTRNLVQGAAGTTYPIERLGIPAIVLADGPAGLRITPIREGDKNTYYCTGFPIGTLLASTWNTNLVEQVGTAMGNEVLEYGVDVLLAPALNIHRHPLNGRNFEYYSEDPLVTGKTAAAMVKGVQSNGVGTSIKHFAVNNQETNRMNNDARVTPRALREIYLKGFEIAVREAEPWTVMSSYNYLNGTYTSESKELLTDVLRTDWGYGGLVMTDWNGGRDAVAQMEAGNDLLMPGRKFQYEQIVAGVKDGSLAMADLDVCVKRVLELIVRSPRYKGYKFSNKPDLKAHAAVTRASAAEGMVLLENNGALPLCSETKNIAVFGTTSFNFIAGGTGSGDVNKAYVIDLKTGLTSEGYTVNPDIEKLYTDQIANYRAEQEKLRKENPMAVFFSQKRLEELIPAKADLDKAATASDVALITIGRSSGEFFDRKTEDFYLTKEELSLIEKVSAAFHAEGKKVVVILNVGGVVETASWKQIPDAVLLAWQPGQEGGYTVADILSGKVTPSGKLTMTFPNDYTDHLSSQNFPTEYEADWRSLFTPGEVKEHAPVKDVDYTNYVEDIFVGYRYFDTFGKQVSYPFGYGKSYTTFEYSDAKIAADGGKYTVSVTVKNTGKYPGKEVVQLYVSAPSAGYTLKPDSELRGYAKTGELKPGQSETVKICFAKCDLASYSEAQSAWVVDAGDYTARIAASSRDIKARLPFTVTKECEHKTTDVLKLTTEMTPFPMNTMARGRGGAPFVSPEVHADGSVTFRISAPEAAEVQLRGDWMAGYINRTAMVKGENGVWEYTTEPISADLHQYYFYVDGVKICDPANLHTVRDGTRIESAVMVKGEHSANFFECEGPKGELSKVWYHSDAYGADRRLYVYTPNGYHEGKNKQKYPVLYLQHGGGGDEDAWTTLGRAVQILDNLIAQGKATPMIVVMPNANPNQVAAPDVAAPLPAQPMERNSAAFNRGGKYVESFINEIVPFVEANYRVIPKKSGRAIAGLSMGGIYTVAITKAAPELFDYIGVLSMGISPETDAVAELAPVKAAGYKLYWVGCGESDFAWPSAENLIAGLEASGMPYTYFGEIGGHTWATWRTCLDELAPKLFK